MASEDVPMAETPPLIVMFVKEGSFLAYIDGSPLGEVTAGADPLCIPFAPEGTHYILMIPLHSDEYTPWLPSAYKLNFSRGELVLPVSGQMEVIHWPGHIFSVEISPSRAQAGASSGHIVRQLEWRPRAQQSLLATLYYDGSLHLALEDTAHGETVWQSDFRSMHSGTLETVQIVSPESRELVVQAQGKGSGRSLVLSWDSSVVALLDEESDSLTFSGGQGGAQAVCVKKLGDLAGHTCTKTFVMEEGAFTLRSAEYVAPQPPVKADSPLKVATAFLDAVVLGLKDEAMSFLTSSLKSGLSMDDLKAYFDGYARHARPPFIQACEGCSMACLGLLYQKAPRFCKARIFKFEMQKTDAPHTAFLISNIDES